MRQLAASFDSCADRLCRDAVGPVGVAVSGGGDSVALLLLARQWAARTGRNLLALTFDHQLRPESAREAQVVADLSARLGVPHRTLTWTNAAHGQEKARNARHTSLATALRRAGGTHLMMGHTRDDQRETFLMRARQGSHWYGLGGIRPLGVSPAWPEGRRVMIARPVLEFSRASLRDCLAEGGTRWIDDPSNEDEAYERIRMRRLLSKTDLNTACIDGIIRDFAHLRAAEDRRLAAWMRAHVSVTQTGQVEVTSGALPPESFVRALSLLLQMVSGQARAPRGEALVRLADAVCRDQARGKHTLHGAVIKYAEGKMHISREAAGMPARPLNDGIWDNRFALAEGDVYAFEAPIADVSASHRATLPPSGRWNCLIQQRFQGFLRMFDANI